MVLKKPASLTQGPMGGQVGDFLLEIEEGKSRAGQEIEEGKSRAEEGKSTPMFRLHTLSP